MAIPHDQPANATTTATTPSRQRIWRHPAWLAVVTIVILAPLWHLHVINRDMPPAKADFVPIWVAARTALLGGNPYSDATTRQIQTAYYGRPLSASEARQVNKMAFAYPAHTLILFAACAPFSWALVRGFLLILLPLLTALAVFLWLRIASIRLSRGSTALVLTVAMASWPVLWGIHQIQPTLIVAALVAAGCYFVQRGSFINAGFVFAIATIKPQLVAPLIVWLILWTLLRREWTFIVSFAVALSVMLAGAARLAPGWFVHWRVATADYAVYRHLKLELAFLFGRWPALLVCALIGCGAAVALWRGRRCAPDSREFASMCALTLAATVCCLPTELAMTYNYVLLLPACLILIFSEPQSTFGASVRRFAFAQLVLDFVAVLVAVCGETLFRPSNSWDSLPFMDFLLPTLAATYLFLEALHSPVSVLSDQQARLEPVAT